MFDSALSAAVDTLTDGPQPKGAPKVKWSTETAAQELAELVRRCDDDTLAEGCDWYSRRAPKVIRRIAAESGVTFCQAAGILAAANVNASWSGSITLAHKFAKQMAAGEPISGGLSTVVDKVQRIANGERPSTVFRPWPKISAFYRNMTGNYVPVTVDRWAARAAGAEHLLGTQGGYAAIEAAYVDAAHEVGMLPAEVQAIVWVSIRGAAG